MLQPQTDNTVVPTQLCVPIVVTQLLVLVARLLFLPATTAGDQRPAVI